MTFMNRLNLLAQIASKRTDVIIVAFMLMAIAMMIIPLPTYLVDALIGVNIALSLLILIVAFYINHSVEFSALPPLILLSTLFRLSLSITTTRLILLDGNAGHIVKAFGDFVIAGQVVVGLVVFLIITVAQFVVITKGAERVAEVAARFTLDAMPGKQMSIDNDLRNGDIDQAEARRRRSRLERESQMFGAMDGAMKFVKGDAIAGLVILFVNLLGGMMIGMVERGMPFAEAAHTYSLLTVGDGLIAQIPALLISVAAGTVVTRVNSDGEERDLGTEIVRQLGASHRALGLTALILLGVGLLPGFPLLVFVTLAAVLGGSAVVLWRRARTGASVPAIDLPEDEPAMEPDAPEVLETFERPLDSRVLLSVGDGLAQVAPLQPLRQQALALPRRNVSRRPNNRNRRWRNRPPDNRLSSKPADWQNRLIFRRDRNRHDNPRPNRRRTQPPLRPPKLRHRHRPAQTLHRPQPRRNLRRRYPDPRPMSPQPLANSTCR